MVDFAWKYLGPVVRPVIWLVAPLVSATVKLAAATASEARHGAYLLWAGTVAGWSSFLTLLTEAWRGVVIAAVGIGVAAGYLGREISSAYEAIARLAARAGREISRIGAEVWQVVSDGLAYLGGVIGALAKVVQGGLQELLRGLAGAARYFASGVAWAMQPKSNK